MLIRLIVPPTVGNLILGPTTRESAPQIPLYYDYHYK